MQNQEEEMNIADIDVEDVDDMNETDEDSDHIVEDVDLIEDSENIVTNDLEYISHFVDIPVIAPKEDILPTLSNQQNREEGSEDSESEMEEDEAQDKLNDKESESETSSDEDEEEIIPKKKSEGTWLTEEEEDGAAADVPPRTKHEIVEEEAEKDVVDYPRKIDDLQLLTKVGYVLYQILAEKTIVIQADQTTTPLNESSIICDKNGIIVGRISEVFGPVTTPFYIVRFRIQKKVSSESGSEDNKNEEIYDLPSLFNTGTEVFTIPSFASFITPNILSTLKMKGSDASNAFDEEPQEDELEYSDDEQEQAAKQAKRKKNQPKTGTTSEGGMEGPRPKLKIKPRVPSQTIHSQSFPQPQHHQIPPQMHPSAYPYYPQFQQPPAQQHVQPIYSNVPSAAYPNYSAATTPQVPQYPNVLQPTNSYTNPNIYNSFQFPYAHQQQQQQQLHHQFPQQPQPQVQQQQPVPGYTLMFSPESGQYHYIPTTALNPLAAQVQQFPPNVKPPEPPKPQMPSTPMPPATTSTNNTGIPQYQYQPIQFPQSKK